MHEVRIRTMSRLLRLFWRCCILGLSFFFFNDTATTEIYTLSLHDALPICARDRDCWRRRSGRPPTPDASRRPCRDRKSTRLNSSHLVISYAVFCLKKKISDGRSEDRCPESSSPAFRACWPDT